MPIVLRNCVVPNLCILNNPTGDTVGQDHHEDYHQL